MNYIKRFEELTYTDTYPSEFITFRKEYNKFKNDGSYYVQFTDHKNDVLDRTVYTEPNHTDPAGNYGYPLKYIIDYPSDLWYGHNSKFLRVIKANPGNKTLFFNELKTEDDCRVMLRNIFKYTRSELTEAISITKKHFKSRLGLKNVGYWGRMTLQIIQVDPFSSDFDDYEVRSASEQSEILINAGFDAFGDYSKKDTAAVINHREPEQICFLTRKSFSVDKIFTLQHTKKGKTSNTFSPQETNISQRIAIGLFSYMGGDRIAGKNSDPSMSSTIYSKGGRSISILYQKNQSYFDNKKLGQKLHRVNKFSDDNYIEIDVTTEKGTFEYISHSLQEVDDIISDLQRKWDTIKDSDTINGWIPRTDKQAKIEIEESRQRFHKEESDKKEAKEREVYKTWMADYTKWCVELNLDFRFNNYENAFRLYSSYFLPNTNVVRNSSGDWKNYISNHSKEMFLFQYPDFDVDLLESFIDSFVVINDRLLEIDKMFIEYNFKSYLNKKGDT